MCRRRGAASAASAAALASLLCAGPRPWPPRGGAPGRGFVPVTGTAAAGAATATGVLAESELRTAGSQGGAERLPPSEEAPLLWALGCELWTVGNEMLIASSSLTSGELGGPGWGRRSLSPASMREPPVGGFTSHLPTVLSSGGNAMRDAGDAMLDGHWGKAWRRLEVASSSCVEYWPASSFTGLVDLVFSHAELVPDWQGEARASASLQHLAEGLEVAVERINQNPELQYPFRERAAAVLLNAAEVLREAADFFEAGGGFYMPRDPRGAHFAAERDVHGLYDEEYDSEDDLEDEESYQGGRAGDGGHLGDEGTKGEAGVYFAARVAEIREELERASALGPSARRSTLKRLVRESHPDQNPGREAQVLPIFSYVLRMLRLSEQPRPS